MWKRSIWIGIVFSLLGPQWALAKMRKSSNKTTINEDRCDFIPLKKPLEGPIEVGMGRPMITALDHYTYRPRYVEKLGTCLLPLTRLNSVNFVLDYERSPVDFLALGRWMRESKKIADEAQMKVDEITRVFSEKPQESVQQAPVMWAPPGRPPMMLAPPVSEENRDELLESKIQEVREEMQESLKRLNEELDGQIQILFTGVTELAESREVSNYLCLTKIDKRVLIDPSSSLGHECQYVRLLSVKHTGYIKDQNEKQSELINNTLAAFEKEEEPVWINIGYFFGMNKISEAVNHMANEITHISHNVGGMKQDMGQMVDHMGDISEEIQQVRENMSQMSEGMKQMTHMMGYLGVNVSQMGQSMGKMQQTFTPWGMAGQMMGPFQTMMGPFSSMMPFN